MKLVFVTQRVDVHDSHRERRDALDQRWVRFLLETAAMPVPVPNVRHSADALLCAVPPDGIVLTGGNSPCDHGGNAPERDEIDSLLIDYAVTHATPLIGVCRGLQSIVQYFGGSLQPIEGHVGTSHSVSGKVNRMVNSYHTLSVAAMPPNLEAFASSDDGSVEMLGHVRLPIIGIMWHPERETRFIADDLALFERHWASTGDRQ